MTTLFEGTHNARDVGGIPLADGGVVRSGVLLRSDALGPLTESGVAALASSPVGVVIDFRTDGERAHTPDNLAARIPAGREITVIDLPILEGATADMAASLFSRNGGTPDPKAVDAALAALPTLADLYTGMLAHGAPAFAEVARRIAASSDDRPSAVLVHCTAGKDRTGVATAVMLDAAGADRAAIVADYADTAANLAGPWAEAMLGQMTRMGIPVTPALRELATGSPAAAIEAALAWIDTQGGSAAYLRSGGLTDAELAALRARLRG